MENKPGLESVLDYFNTTAEQFSMMRVVAALTSETGDRMFADPMSAWSRKLQVFALGFSSITLLLASGLVSTVEATEIGFKASLPPELAAMSTALVTLGGLVFYVVSCHQDWTLHSIRSDAAIKEIAELSLTYSLEAFETTRKVQAKREANAKADEEQARKDSEDSAEITRLEAERARGFFPSWKTVKLATIYARLQKSLITESAAAEVELRALSRRAEALAAASSTLSELLEQYRSHLRLRTLVEVLAPILYGCFSAWIAFHPQLLLLLGRQG